MLVICIVSPPEILGFYKWYQSLVGNDQATPGQDPLSVGYRCIYDNYELRVSNTNKKF